MMDFILNILPLGVPFSVFFWLGVKTYIDFQKEKVLGHAKKKPEYSDCKETARMMVEFIGERMNGKERQGKECGVGCDGNFTLSNSNEIAEMVRIAHHIGCRIVVKKVSEEDIEDPSNDKDTACRFLENLDIKRAKRIEKKMCGK